MICRASDQGRERVETDVTSTVSARTSVALNIDTEAVRISMVRDYRLRTG